MCASVCVCVWYALCCAGCGWCGSLLSSHAFQESGFWGGRGTKGHEMTLQIQLLAFHLPLTATWRGAAPGIPPPTRHTANARPRRDNLRGGGGRGKRGAPPRKKSQETICCFDSPLIRRLSGRCLFNYGKPVKTSSAVHMCVTAEARLRGPRPAHVHVAHERGLCGGGWGGTGRISYRSAAPPKMETHQGQRQPARKPESIFMDAEHVAHFFYPLISVTSPPPDYMASPRSQKALRSLLPHFKEANSERIKGCACRSSSLFTQDV